MSKRPETQPQQQACENLQDAGGRQLKTGACPNATPVSGQQRKAAEQQQAHDPAKGEPSLQGTILQQQTATARDHEVGRKQERQAEQGGGRSGAVLDLRRTPPEIGPGALVGE